MRPSTTLRGLAATVGVLGISTLGITGAGAQTSDQHAGVLSAQGERDVSTPVVAMAETEAVATPAPASSPTPSAAPTLPMTGSDVVAITGVGLGLIATGFVVKRRYSS